jgi:hypothetical protein
MNTTTTPAEAIAQAERALVTLNAHRLLWSSEIGVRRRLLLRLIDEARKAQSCGNVAVPVAPNLNRWLTLPTYGL